MSAGHRAELSRVHGLGVAVAVRPSPGHPAPRNCSSGAVSGLHAVDVWGEALEHAAGSWGETQLEHAA